MPTTGEQSNSESVYVPGKPYQHPSVGTPKLMTRFNHAPWESLRRQNVLAWLSWSCFTLPYEEAKKNRSFMTYLEKTMKTLEARTGTIIPEGYDPEISILRLTLDPVNVSTNSHGPCLVSRADQIRLRVDLSCCMRFRTVSMLGFEMWYTPIKA
jgi:hypothetical protein